MEIPVVRQEKNTRSITTFDFDDNKVLRDLNFKLFTEYTFVEKQILHSQSCHLLDKWLS